MSNAVKIDISQVVVISKGRRGRPMVEAKKKKNENGYMEGFSLPFYSRLVCLVSLLVGMPLLTDALLPFQGRWTGRL